MSFVRWWQYLIAQESHNWVMAFYRATGQAHKPAPPVTTGKNPTNTKNGDADIARKHGMEEYIAADPITFDHALLFKKLQSYSLDWRLSDPFSSLVKHNMYKTSSTIRFTSLGLVYPWSDVPVGRVLCSLRSSWLLQTPLLPGRSAG